MANCLGWNIWCFSGPSLFCNDLFIRPFECEHLWYLPLFLQISSNVWVEIFEAASIHFTSLESSTQILFNGPDPESIWPRQVLCISSELVSTRKEEISWKKCWKYKVSALQQHAKHSGDAAAVLYFKLLLFLRWHSLPLHERLVFSTLQLSSS